MRCINVIRKEHWLFYSSTNYSNRDINNTGKCNAALIISSFTPVFITVMIDETCSNQSDCSDSSLSQFTTKPIKFKSQIIALFAVVLLETKQVILWALFCVDKHSTIKLSLHQYWWSFAGQLPSTGFAPILCVAFGGVGIYRTWLDERVQENAPEWELT